MMINAVFNWIFMHGVAALTWLGAGVLGTIASFVHFEAEHREARGWLLFAVLNFLIAVPIYNTFSAVNRRIHPVRPTPAKEPPAEDNLVTQLTKAREAIFVGGEAS